MNDGVFLSQEAILAENLATLTGALRRLSDCLPAHLDTLCDLVAGYGEPLGDRKPTVTDDGLAFAFRSVTEAVREAWGVNPQEFSRAHVPLTLPRPDAPGLATIADHPGVATTGAAAQADPCGLCLYDALSDAMAPVIGAAASLLLADRVILSEGPAAPSGRSRIAYFRNTFSDIAERRFASLLPDPTVAYFSDFSAICEELAAERADYAILPVRSSSDGRLPGVERRILRYGLCPVAYTDVITEGEKTVTYALFASEPKAPTGATQAEILAFCDEGRELSSLFSAASALGLRLTDCSRMPDERSYQTTYRLVFDLGSLKEAPRRFTALRIYLATSFPHSLLAGLTCTLPAEGFCENDKNNKNSIK